MRSINLIVVHCSATRVTHEFSVKDLKACHLARGYKTIGYHYYITKDGKVHRCRPEEMVGAHARRYNAHSIGVCYEGGLDANGKTDDTRTPAQKRTLVALLRSLKADYPDAQILGHRDLPWVTKKCPCFDARTEYKDLQPLILEQ
jgi:N-acetyl-anhydromuramyl-L-alanine amidase AmpD